MHREQLAKCPLEIQSESIVLESIGSALTLEVLSLVLELYDNCPYGEHVEDRLKE